MKLLIAAILFFSTAGLADPVVYEHVGCTPKQSNTYDKDTFTFLSVEDDEYEDYFVVVRQPGREPLLIATPQPHVNNEAYYILKDTYDDENVKGNILLHIEWNPQSRNKAKKIALEIHLDWSDSTSYSTGGVKTEAAYDCVKIE